jgi:hypothetical protein
MRRRKKRSRKTYSIAYLLAHQPKTLQKHPYYQDMMHHYHSSEQLRRVRFSRRCYSLLQHAKISPENLTHFYRTYRLPRDPFFPLFFSIKRAYLQDRQRKREERTAYIVGRMRRLPAPVLEFIKLLAQVEQKGCNRAGYYPVWSEELFPHTKKRVREYERFETSDWLELFRSHMRLLDERYTAFSRQTGEQLIACFLLELLPETADSYGTGRSMGEMLRLPGPDQIKRSYRRLSKLHHPDSGGDAEYFVELKQARDLLIDGRSGAPGNKEEG